MADTDTDADKPKESMLDRMKEKAREMQDSVAEKIADISEAGLDKAREIQDSVKEKIADISEAGLDKLKEVVANVNEMLPFVRELGYTVDGIQVAVGLIPSISIDVSGLTKVMDEETFRRMLEQQKENPLLVGVLRALQATSALQQKIKLGGMQSDSAAIVIGLPPKITLKFK